MFELPLGAIIDRFFGKSKSPEVEIFIKLANKWATIGEAFCRLNFFYSAF